MFRVTDKALDLQELLDFVADPEAGAITTFIGTTRNNNEGRRVIALDYDAYPEMAEKELRPHRRRSRKKMAVMPDGDRASHRSSRRLPRRVS